MFWIIFAFLTLKNEADMESFFRFSFGNILSFWLRDWENETLYKNNY